MSTRLIGFDFDGTLVRTFTAEPLPGAREALAALPGGAQTFVATNQAGPVFRALTGDPTYPTVDQVVANIRDGLAALEWWPHLLVVCVAHPQLGERPPVLTIAQQMETALALARVPTSIVTARPLARKPQPGMLTFAAEQLWSDVMPIYIGDMDSDRLAAEAAGFRFVWANDWRAGEW